MRHPAYCHEVENCVSHLLPGGALPHYWGNSVQSPGAASWEFPKTGHSCRKTGFPGYARLCKLLWAGGSDQGRWKHQHHINYLDLFSSAGPADASQHFNALFYKDRKRKIIHTEVNIGDWSSLRVLTTQWQWARALTSGDFFRQSKNL